MRNFIDPIDIEFNKKNSIYDISTDLRNELILLELDTIMIKNNTYYKTIIDSNSPVFDKNYSIVNNYDINNYHIVTGYIAKQKDIVGMSNGIKLVNINGKDCIVFKLDIDGVVNINYHLEDDEEFDFTILGTSNRINGDLFSGVAYINKIKTIEYIILNKRKKIKYEETNI